MAIQSSGQVSLNDLHVEAGGTSGTECSFNDSDIRGLISASSASEMEMADWYGAANVFTLTISSNTANANLSTLATAAGWNGSAPLECTINSGVWCYATSTGSYGLTVNVANATITNYGKIIGRGGNGRAGQDYYSSGGLTGYAGGHALRVTVGGVTIVNASGAYIAGGGGGGGGGYTSSQSAGGGGGGAGGGNGGAGDTGSAQGGNGSGGGLNASGSNGFKYSSSNGTGYGGQAGGSGGTQGIGGGGGGRILPGTQAAGDTFTGRGGAGGQAGGGGQYSNGGGGGGWGAAGGTGSYNRGYGSASGGGAAGRAISRTTSITLSNSGTIYGAT